MVPRLSADYDQETTETSFGILLEVFSILGKYKDGLTLVGGWAPFLFLEAHQGQGDEFVHVGSIDIDLAVDPRKVDEDAYAGIVDLLTDRAYKPKLDKAGRVVPASYERTVAGESKSVVIQVDFLTSEEFGRASRRHVVVQESLRVRRARGCEAAFDFVEEYEVEGKLPGGGTRSMKIRGAALGAILAMKGIVLGERFKEKDAYDIHSVIAHVDGGPAAAAGAISAISKTPVVKEGLDQIRKDFSTEDSNGPVWAATFLAPDDVDLRRAHQADAFLTVGEFIRRLDASG